MLYLSILLQLVLEVSVLFTIHQTTISSFKIKCFLKFIIALHVSAYSAIIRCVEIRENCCVFCVIVIGVFAFIIFLNEVNVVVEGTGGGTTLTSFKNVINAKTPIAVLQKT
jgi:hypothetical protein